MQIYIAEGTQQTGPFDLETIKTGLRAGKYQPAQLAWYEGAAGWEPLNKLPGLESFFAPPAPSPPPPPPVAPPAAYPPAPAAYPPAPGTGAPPAPYGTPPAYNAPYPPLPAAPASAGKKLGGCLTGGAVLLLFLVRLLVGGSHSYHSYSSSPANTPAPSRSPAFSSSSGSPGVSSPSGNSGFSSSALSSSSSAETKHYTNKQENFTVGNRAAAFVPFGFDYPVTWRLSSGTGTSDQNNYVELIHPMQIEGNSKNVEQIAVGAFRGKGGGAAPSPEAIAQFIDQVEQKIRPGFLSYHRVSQGPTKVNGYNGYDYRSEGTQDDDGQTVQIYVRCVALTPGTGPNGVFIFMMSSSYAPDMHSANDVGVKGGTGVFLSSFRFQ